MKCPFIIPWIVPLTLIIGHTVSEPTDLTSLSWVSIELLRGQVLVNDVQECIKLRMLTLPRIDVILDDGETAQRVVKWTVLQPDGRQKIASKSWPVEASSAWFVYYTRNASLSAHLIAHNALYKDPLANSEVISKSSVVSIPLTDAANFALLSSPCFNLTLSIRQLDLADFVPTTTPRADVLAQGVFMGVSDKNGVGQASLPVWAIAVVSLFMMLFLIAFAALLVIHLQSRRRVSKLTIQHQTHHNGCSNNTSSGRRSASSTATATNSSSPNGVVRSNSLESHYDVPWDQKFRPLPEWLRTDLATSLTDAPKPRVPVRPIPCPGMVHTGDSGVESLN